MILCPSCKRRTSDLLLSLKDELDVMLESTLAYHELESLDMHEELSLVIVCSTCVNSSIADLRLERIRVPELDRIYRLNVIVAVNEHCRKRRIYHLLAEHYRMTCCRIYRSLVSTCLHKKLYEPLCAALHVRLMLLKRADRRNPQE